VKDITARGVKLRVVELSAPEDELVKSLSGVNILISAIGPHDLLQQKTLVKAAKEANIKRFVPCAWITICPPKGVMVLRDEVWVPSRPLYTRKFFIQETMQLRSGSFIS